MFLIYVRRKAQINYSACIGLSTVLFISSFHLFLQTQISDASMKTSAIENATTNMVVVISFIPFDEIAYKANSIVTQIGIQITKSKEARPKTILLQENRCDISTV